MQSKPQLAFEDGVEMQQIRLSITQVDDDKLNYTFSEIEDPFNEIRTKRLVRKLDRNIIPVLAALYLLSFLDRSNIGNAKLDGLEHDLGMHGLQYNIALSVFFPFYVLAEIPSNLMLKRTSPSFWIAFIMFWWGTVMTLTGLVKDYRGMLICRMALGLAEGGFFPGVTFYITLWYKRHECGFRMALFFSAATLAGAFGGVLARGIIEMAGMGGLAGWAWIFILEGGITVIASIVAYFVIYDYPETSRFLSSSEKIEVRRRLDEERDGLAEEYSTRFLVDALTDWKIYVMMVIAIGVYIPLYSFSLFLPTIVKGMGYTATDSQLVSVPPYVVACFSTITFGYLADRHKQRGVYMMASCLIAAAGFAMLIATDNPTVQYIGTFFAASGVYPNIPMITAWTGNNIGGATKRGVGIAMQVGFGNLGGVVAGFTYRYTEAPRYFSGHALLIGSVTMSATLAGLMSLYLRRENARREDQLPAMGKRSLEDFSAEEKNAMRHMGDNATFFRYTV